MPPTPQELAYLLHPLVPEAIAHNTRILSTIRSLTSLLLGISAGLLGLESLAGFAYYIIGSCIVSLLIHVVLAQGRPDEFFVGSGVENESTGGKGGGGKEGEKGGRRRYVRRGAWREIWLGGGVLGEALSGFVLGWAGVGGLVR